MSLYKYIHGCEVDKQTVLTASLISLPVKYHSSYFCLNATLFLAEWHSKETQDLLQHRRCGKWNSINLLHETLMLCFNYRRVKLKLIFMSFEVEKIHLGRLKMDETLNLWGRDVCIILARSCNMDEIVGSHECQVISLFTLLNVCVRCVCVCVPVCISISVCGHRSRKAVAWPHRFHALFSHLFTSPLRLTSLLPLLLFLLLFWSVAHGDGSPR